MRRHLLVIGACLAAIVVLLSGVSYVGAARERSLLGKLFDGPSELSVPDPPSFYPQITYDLTEYNSVKSEDYQTKVRLPISSLPQGPGIDAHAWVDGAGREELEARMRRRAAVDGVTAASKLVRLRSPSIYRGLRPSRHLRISYPPDGALFPPNLCTPCIEWEDAINDVWQVLVQIEGADKQWTDISKERSWWFPEDIWRQIRSEATQRPVRIEVKGTQSSPAAQARTIQISPPVRFHIAGDPCDAFIVYRLVCPPFSTLKTPDTFVRDISSFKTRMFLSARRSYCFNCHSFSSTLGTTGKVAIQCRYMLPGPQELKTYFGLFDIDKQHGERIALPFEVQMSTFVTWSPNGVTLAMSANQQLATLQPIVYETQFAGQPTSDIAICNIDQKTAYLLPGASNPDELEIFPRWTPDGQSLVFCWSQSGFHPALVKYDLRVIPFNGGKGGTATPIPGASNNSRGNYYPRFSPDNKWLSFCQSDGGCLIKSSSDIYLMPSDLKGAPRRLECNSEFTADSWHSWSSNSRWIVFASKRDDGIFARLYLTHISEDGHASPAVQVPLKQLPMESFNIPELLSHDPMIREKDLYNALRVESQPVAIKELKDSS